MGWAGRGSNQQELPRSKKQKAKWLDFWSCAVSSQHRCTQPRPPHTPTLISKFCDNYACNCMLSLEVLGILWVAHYIQGTKRPQYASSGCLKEIKIVKKWSWLLIRGGCYSWEVLVKGLWLGKFWCFGLVAAYERWSHMEVWLYIHLGARSTRQTLPNLSSTLFSSYFALPSQRDFTWLKIKFAHTCRKLTAIGIACSRCLGSGAQHEGREQEKNKEEKRERERGGTLTPTPPPCLFFFSCLNFFALSPWSECLEQATTGMLHL